MTLWTRYAGYLRKSLKIIRGHNRGNNVKEKSLSGVLCFGRSAFKSSGTE
jgi:hypothetical protein